ncbi:MAG: hypothetical protein IJT64_05495, partial [Kiritimatiellae bacterium]|nr:hypothetical protein [Kiritimatiellia bacterium]
MFQVLVFSRRSSLRRASDAFIYYLLSVIYYLRCPAALSLSSLVLRRSSLRRASDAFIYYLLSVIYYLRCPAALSLSSLVLRRLVRARH